MKPSNTGPRKVARRRAENPSDVSLYTEVNEQTAQKRGFKSHQEYRKYYRQKAGASTASDYQKILAHKKGLKSQTEYQKSLAAIRQGNPEYQKLARLITMRLSELGMNYSQLARRVGVAPIIISRYARAQNYPKPNRLRKVLQALGVFHNSPIRGRTHLLGDNVPLQKPRNQKYIELSNSIKYYLTKYRKDRYWLANMTGISLGHITTYIEGLVYPKADRLKRIEQTLKSLDSNTSSES